MTKVYRQSLCTMSLSLPTTYKFIIKLLLLVFPLIVKKLQKDACISQDLCACHPNAVINVTVRNSDKFINHVSVIFSVILSCTFTRCVPFDNLIIISLDYVCTENLTTF